MVAVWAMTAAPILRPGVFFGDNSPAGIVGQAPETAATTISAWGFPVTAAQMASLAHAVGEQTLYNRTGGEPPRPAAASHDFFLPLRRGCRRGAAAHFLILVLQPILLLHHSAHNRGATHIAPSLS